MSEYQGRAAWSIIGGTLKRDLKTGKTIPGPYYMARIGKATVSPGVAPDDVLLAGGTPDLNQHAVWYGVLALKKALKREGYTPDDLILNGRWGPAVVDGALAYQAANGLVQDGVIGPKTAKALFLPWLEDAARDFPTVRPVIASGLVTNESGWDPGAVGSVDSSDHGLAQLNATSQNLSLAESFDPAFAFDRLLGIMERNLAAFGNERDAIAAYNLGKTGAELWISEGRPEWFIPKSLRPDGPARNVWAYIDRILAG